MKRLRLLVSLSGPAGAYRPGEEGDFDDAEAERLIAAGFAAPVAVEPIETADSKSAARREKAITRGRS